MLCGGARGNSRRMGGRLGLAALPFLVGKVVPFALWPPTAGPIVPDAVDARELPVVAEASAAARESAVEPPFSPLDPDAVASG